MQKKLFPKNPKVAGRIGSLVFILLFLAVSYYYDYHNILTKRPQSIHRWRQSDCASIALNYYQHGMKFFRPEVHLLSSDNRTTGYAVGECPMYYYFIAFLYKLFGYNELIYRLVNTIILFLGLFALYKLLEHWLKDPFWGIAVSLLFFTSPVMVYYANNFLPDTISFAFVLIAWNLFFRYTHSGNLKYLNLTFLFFALAGLLKITAAINVIAILCVYILNLTGWKRLYQHRESFHFNLKTFLPFLFYFVLVISWYLFAIHYNRVHQSEYFSTRAWPIWQLSGETIRWIGDQFRDLWLADYYHSSVLILFLLSFILILVFWKRAHPDLRILTLLLFTGVVLFSLLLFYAFGNHDYYIIGLMILPVFILLTALDLLGHLNRYVIRSWSIRIFFSLFVIFNVYYAEKRLDWRYHGWINEYPVSQDLHTVTPYLRSLGISPEDKVISLPDETSCYSLYMMNQKGWTERYLYNRDSLGIQESISLGARYLVLTGEEVKQRPYLQYFTKNKIGDFNDISIYSLTDF